VEPSRFVLNFIVNLADVAFIHATHFFNFYCINNLYRNNSYKRLLLAPFAPNESKKEFFLKFKPAKK